MDVGGGRRMWRPGGGWGRDRADPTPGRCGGASPPAAPAASAAATGPSPGRTCRSPSASSPSPACARRRRDRPSCRRQAARGATLKPTPSPPSGYCSSAAAPIGLALSSSRLPALPAPHHHLLLLRCTAAVLLLLLHRNQPEHAWKRSRSPSVSLLDLDRLP